MEHQLPTHHKIFVTMDEQDEEKKQLHGSSMEKNRSNDDHAPPELPRPGAVSVSGAAPRGKPTSHVSVVKNSLPPTETETVAQLNNSGSNLAPMEPEAYKESSNTDNATTTTNVNSAPPVVASSASALARTNRRMDTKAAIREERNVLRNQGIVQSPGVVSVSSPSVAADVATRVAPSPSSSASNKAAMKREIEMLNAADPAILNRPGAHSVTASSATPAESSNHKFGDLYARSERRRAQKNNQTPNSSLTTSATSQQQVGAQPSSGATKKEILLKKMLIRLGPSKRHRPRHYIRLSKWWILQVPLLHRILTTHYSVTTLMTPRGMRQNW